jgi:hypothetical protein
MTDPQAASQVRSEIADVFLYLTRLARDCYDAGKRVP